MKSFLREKGQGLVEYALLIVLIAMVVLGILTLLGPQISNAYGRVIAALSGSVITNATVSVKPGGSGYDYTLTVQVIEATTLTFESTDLTFNNMACSPPSCSVTRSSGTIRHGTYTLKADGGSKGTFSGSY